jgi:hypothetical protein
MRAATARAPQAELAYRLRDRDVRVTACGRICRYRRCVTISTVGTRLGLKEIDTAFGASAL